MVGLVRRTGTVDELIAQAHKDAGLRAAMYCCVSGQGAFRKMLAETLTWRRAVRVSSALLRNLLRSPRCGTSCSEPKAGARRKEGTDQPGPAPGGPQ